MVKVSKKAPVRKFHQFDEPYWVEDIIDILNSDCLFFKKRFREQPDLITNLQNQILPLKKGRSTQKRPRHPAAELTFLYWKCKQP